jgi:hypothetical protein
VKRVVALSAFSLIIAGVIGLSAQGMPQGEMASSVPELDAFHDVIMPMWHTAYPDKDYAALRGMAKDVQAGTAKIAGARLPGILRDKEAAWRKGVVDLQTASDAYIKAAAGKDDAALLTAAETLHTRYEGLVRLVRPVLKEMDDFHKVLYVVNHKYLPEKQWDAVCSASPDLVAKSEAIAAATLPARLQSRTDAFKKASEGLVGDAKQLAGICSARKQAEVEKAVGALHLRYQGLEKVFE